MKEASEEDVEYESDPEEAKLSLKMRRREASDDEEEEESEKTEKPLRRIGSDSELESEGQGAAGQYEEEEDEEEYVEEEEEEELYEEAEAVTEAVNEVVEQERGSSPQEVDDGNELKELEEKEKKENQPYAVPTAGAFYMHDDRFGHNVGGRHKRMSGGRRLWESKDDHKWGHDKFEELTVDERNYAEDRRVSRGRYRGRGRIRGADSGASRGRRPRAYINDRDQTNDNNQKIQNNPSKAMRGRGPRRYRPSFNDNVDTSPPINKQYGQSVDKPSLNSTKKASAPLSNLKNDAVTSASQGVVSRLNYASPPFYPSSSSSKETTITQKREVRTGTSSRSVQPSLSGESSAQSTADLNGSICLNKLNIDDSNPAVAGKPSSNFQSLPGSSSINFSHSQAFRGQGRGFNALPHMNYQSPVPNNQVNRISLPTQLHPAQRYSVQSRGQQFPQVTGQQFAQQPGTGSQVSSPPKTGQLMNTCEPGEHESSSESNALKCSMVAKGKGSLQGAGRGYGVQVMGAPGNMSSGNSDQNFSGTPAIFPVMQFGGQHPGGIGVPAVGMAFPGYVGQPQNGKGKSEMTWLPVLAGAAGALGATYCSPYIAVDGSYNPRPSGQISALDAAPIREDASKPDSELKPQQRPEVTNDDFGLRQKNTRRYTEMKFDQ